MRAFLYIFCLVTLSFATSVYGQLSCGDCTDETSYICHDRGIENGAPCVKGCDYCHPIQIVIDSGGIVMPRSEMEEEFMLSSLLEIKYGELLERPPALDQIFRF